MWQILGLIIGILMLLAGLCGMANSLHSTDGSILIGTGFAVAGVLIGLVSYLSLTASYDGVGPDGPSV